MSKLITSYSVGIYSKDDLIEMLDGYSYAEAVKLAKKISIEKGNYSTWKGTFEIDSTMVIKFAATKEEAMEDFAQDEENICITYTDYRQWDDVYKDGKKVSRFNWQVETISKL